MVKRVETGEEKVKLTLLIPKSVAVAIKEAAKLADESQSLFIVTLLELYQTLGSATQPVVEPEIPALPMTDIPPVPPPAAPQVPRLGAMQQMEASLDAGYGGQSEAARMLQLRLAKDPRGGSMERIHRQSKAATETEE